MKKRMFRKFVLTLFLAALAASAAAQRPRTRLEWGVLGGINVPDYTTNMTKADVKNKMGWQVGITTAVDLGIIALEPQILYVRQGIRILPEGLSEEALQIRLRLFSAILAGFKKEFGPKRRRK